MFGSFLPQRTLATFGPLAIHWYGLFAAVGALAAYVLGRRLARWANLSVDLFADVYFLGLIFGLIGARLWHVVGDWGFYRQHLTLIPAIWNGGLAIHGGLLLGAVTLWSFSRRRKISFWLLADIFAPMIALAEGIGRWGNYFNQELFGRPTSRPWGIPISPDNRPAGFASATHFHPAFLYESLGLLAITVILVVFFRWRSKRTGGLCPPLLDQGGILGAFLVLAGFLRAIIEQYRIDPLLHVGGVRVPQLVSLLMIFLGLFIFWRLVSRPVASPLPHAETPKS